LSFFFHVPSLAVREASLKLGLTAVCVAYALSAQAQQMPAPVERPVEEMTIEAAPLEDALEGDFSTTGTLATMAPTTTAIMGIDPNPILPPKVYPKSTRTYVPPSKPRPLPQVQKTGVGQFVILPPEAPLVTAPLGTLNAAMLNGETETSLPETTRIERNALTLPAHSIPQTMPAQNIPVSEEDVLTNRLLGLADKLENLSDQAEDIDTRLTKAESPSPTVKAPTPTAPPSAAIAIPRATLPFVNDATTPGPRARAALKKLAEDMSNYTKATGKTPKSLTVTSTVFQPPIGATAGQIGRARHSSTWAILNDYLKPHGLTIPGTGNQLSLETTKNPQNQTHKIRVNW